MNYNINSKKQLAILLSRLKAFEKPSFLLEQYPTDSEIAAEIIWNASQLGDLDNKVIADLGCGTGILGIGCLFLNAKKVYFVDIDNRQLKNLDNNLKLMALKNYEIVLSDVKNFNIKVDVVIQNPPFGTKKEHADKIFLEKAFQIAKVIYSFHKIESKNFIEAISKDNDFQITHYFEFDFPLKNTMAFHEKKVKKIKVGCWRLEKIKK
ncbi:MAG: METTL5 family protein [Candidatus Woesearchaeota archaeon]